MGPGEVNMDNQMRKWLRFSGLVDDYPAWSTKFTALMQTKRLYKAHLRKEVIPDPIAPIDETATAAQRTEWEDKLKERDKQVQDINKRSNTVWCHLVLALDKTSLMYIRHGCLSPDGTGDGAKAWRLLQQRFCSVEKPTVVSLVRQLSRLQLGEGEKLSEYFIRSQELMTRLTEAGEQISETLFNALVINGLPESFEHFVVQESFNPATTFTELRTRLQNYEESRTQRKQTEEDHSVAMRSSNQQTTRESSGSHKGNCFVCGLTGHFARQCAKKSTAHCSKCKKKGHLAKACRRSGNERPRNKEDKNSTTMYSSCLTGRSQREKENPKVENYLQGRRQPPKRGGGLMAVGCNLAQKANNLQKSFAGYFIFKLCNYMSTYLTIIFFLLL